MNDFEELENILNTYRISLRNEDKSFRPFFDVLMDISKKWHDINEDDQDKIVEPFKK